MIYVGLKPSETRKCICSLTLYHHAHGEFFCKNSVANYISILKITNKFKISINTQLTKYHHLINKHKTISLLILATTNYDGCSSGSCMKATALLFIIIDMRIITLNIIFHMFAFGQS